MGHPLEFIWNLFVTRNKKKPGRERTVKDWQDRVKKVAQISFVQEFWTVYNNLKLPTDVHGRGDYYMFRQGILPQWEDPRNQRGGAWVFRANYPQRVNEIWLNSLLMLIGFQLEVSMEHVCGVQMSVRNKNYRLSLWIDSCDETIAIDIGLQLKSIYGGVNLEFHKHNSQPSKVLEI